MTLSRRSVLLACWLVLATASLAEAEVRYYLVPKIGDGSFLNPFRPKYVDLNALGVGWDVRPWQGMDYGLESSFFIRLDTTPAQHSTLSAQTDVLAVPADLDANVGGAALSVIQNKLEGLNLPGQWVTTNHTYRQVLKGVVRLIQFMQKWNGLNPGVRLFGGAVTLDTQVNQLTQNQRDRLRAVADSLSLDMSGVTNQMTIRQALKLIADQLPNVRFGEDTF